MRFTLALFMCFAVACAASAPRVEPASSASADPNADAAVAAPKADAGSATTTAETLPPLDPSDAGEGALLPRVGPSDAGAATGRDDGSLAATMASVRPALRRCYDAARVARPELRGSIALRVVVDPAGRVREASIDDALSEMHDAGLSKCAVDAARALVFAPHAKGRESRLSQTFVLSPGGK